MQALETGTMYFDTSGKGYLPAGGFFVDAVGVAAHTKFAKSFGGREQRLSGYNPVDVVNKLVSNYGLVAVSVPAKWSNKLPRVVSRSKKSALSSDQVGRLEDLLGVEPTWAVQWTDRLNLDGTPVRSLKLAANTVIFGSHEYGGSKGNRGDEESADDAQNEFNKTVRPEPVVHSVTYPSRHPSSASRPPLTVRPSDHPAQATKSKSAALIRAAQRSLEPDKLDTWLL